MNELTKIVKKALSEKYGYKNVQVVNGKGTAWGWVEAKITVPKPDGYDAQSREFQRNPLDRAITQEAERIAQEAVEKAGKKFYTYCSDGGYGDRDCFLLDVDYI